MLFTLVLPHASAVRTQFACSLVNGDPDTVCVHVVGELDIATSPQLELTLHEAQSQSRLVVLDLRDLEFMDATGIHAVVEASLRARRADRRLVLLNGPPHVARLFALTGMAEHLELAGPGILEAAAAAAGER